MSENVKTKLTKLLKKHNHSIGVQIYADKEGIVRAIPVLIENRVEKTEENNEKEK